MAIVNVTCPKCGDQSLPLAAITLTEFPLLGMGLYRFKCKYCSLIVSKPATVKQQIQLRSAGVQAQILDLPLTLQGPQEGPMTDDDLRKFRIALEQYNSCPEDFNGL